MRNLFKSIGFKGASSNMYGLGLARDIMTQPVSEQAVSD